MKYYSHLIDEHARELHASQSINTHHGVQISHLRLQILVGGGDQDKGSRDNEDPETGILSNGGFPLILWSIRSKEMDKPRFPV